MSAPLKGKKLKLEIQAHLEAGAFRFDDHALMRMEERNVIVREIVQVLRNGFNDESQNELDSKYLTWSYAIYGSTNDGRKLKVVVTFVAPNMLIISVVK